eukprot:6110012-Karenia_brevis.AAC.1
MVSFLSMFEQDCSVNQHVCCRAVEKPRVLYAEEPKRAPKDADGKSERQQNKPQQKWLLRRWEMHSKSHL